MSVTLLEKPRFLTISKRTSVGTVSIAKVFLALQKPARTGKNWAHATTREGACGILAAGKVLPTDHSVAGLDPGKILFLSSDAP